MKNATSSTDEKPNKNMSNMSNNKATTLSPQQHTRAMVSLCAVIFCFGYLVISVFPYSGYMAISLVDQANEENAGYYAGFLSSAFMAGRALTSYHWGKAADIYGRTTILYTSLGLSLVFSLLFGLSTHFAVALVLRFFLGLSNGLMGTAKTMVAEIAEGDKTLELRGMGVLVGMWGWFLMVSPAVSGALVLVTQQYPQLLSPLQGSPLYQFLDAYPFFLANALGALLCLVSMGLVSAYIHETLPTPPRPAKHIPSDIVATVHRHVVGPLKNALSTVVEAEDETTISGSAVVQKDERQGLLASKSSTSNNNSNNGYGSTPSDEEDSSRLRSSSDIELPATTLQAFAEHDVEGAIRSSVMSNYDEQSALLSTGNAKHSLAHTMARRSSAAAEERRRSSRRRSTTNQPSEATIASLWAQTNTRNHMIVYWVGSFVQVAVDEGLPLFLLARHGGLGLSAKAIGTILSASGAVFVALQYITYAQMVHIFGLYGSMRVGSSTTGPLIALFPIALLLNEQGRVMERLHVDGYGDLTWSALLYLTILLALFRTLFMAFFSSLLVALNRTVIPQHRGTMNGLATLGGSVTKSLGPSFAGLMAGFSLSSGWFAPASLGAVFLFLVLAGLGGLTTLAVWTLLKDEEEEENAEDTSKENGTT